MRLVGGGFRRRRPPAENLFWSRGPQAGGRAAEASRQGVQAAWAPFSRGLQGPFSGGHFLTAPASLGVLTRRGARLWRPPTSRKESSKNEAEKIEAGKPKAKESGETGAVEPWSVEPWSVALENVGPERVELENVGFGLVESGFGGGQAAVESALESAERRPPWSERRPAD
jgi:hypothetical protein